MEIPKFTIADMVMMLNDSGRLKLDKVVKMTGLTKEGARNYMNRLVSSHNAKWIEQGSEPQLMVLTGKIDFQNFIRQKNIPCFW